MRNSLNSGLWDVLEPVEDRIRGIRTGYRRMGIRIPQERRTRRGRPKPCSSSRDLFVPYRIWYSRSKARFAARCTCGPFICSSILPWPCFRFTLRPLFSSLLLLRVIPLQCPQNVVVNETTTFPLTGPETYSEPSVLGELPIYRYLISHQGIM